MLLRAVTAVACDCVRLCGCTCACVVCVRSCLFLNCSRRTQARAPSRCLRVRACEEVCIGRKRRQEQREVASMWRKYKTREKKRQPMRPRVRTCSSFQRRARNRPGGTVRGRGVAGEDTCSCRFKKSLQVLTRGCVQPEKRSIPLSTADVASFPSLQNFPLLECTPRVNACFDTGVILRILNQVRWFDRG